VRPGLSRIAALAAALCASGCAGTIGVQPAGPGLWVVSEMRAPVLGGGPAAQAAAMGEANGFCGQSGLAPDVLDVTPGGNPYGPYGPVAFTVRFRCVARHAG
jgi:hypothetical protein